MAHMSRNPKPSDQIPNVSDHRQVGAKWEANITFKNMLSNLYICTYIKREPDDWFEEDQQSLDEHGGVHDVQSLDVLLIPEITQQIFLWTTNAKVPSKSIQIC